MKIEQDFDRAEDGTRQLMNESITTEFKLVDNSDGIYAKRDVYYRNYAYESTADALQAFRKPEKVIEGRTLPLIPTLTGMPTALRK